MSASNPAGPRRSASSRTIRSKARRLALLWSAALVLICAGQALAQANPRNTFPGRRVGGGTRGECTSRTLAHLVPTSSVYAPGADRSVALLEGPIATPQPIRVEFRPLKGAPSTPQQRELPAAGAGITLLTPAPGGADTVWSSSYRCDSASATASDDPLAFIAAEAPPALSLLVTDVSAEDRRVQTVLMRLRQSCGGNVPLSEVSQAFGLSDLITTDWPATLPVRCLTLNQP